MVPRFDRTVCSLIDVLVGEVNPEADPFQRRQVAHYVLATVAAMPDHFRLGFRILGMIFELAAIPLCGHRFSSLWPVDQRAYVERWRRSRVSVQRAMIAFYTAFATHGLYQYVQTARSGRPLAT